MTRLEPDTATDVWPPAQAGSAQIAAKEKVVPAAASWEKFPAAPPRVTPLTDSVPLPESLLMQTTRQFPAVVEGMVTGLLALEVL
jgi:hypothetical protein